VAVQKPAESKSTMILISFFLGGLGIHRLMMGYSNWWLMLITLGGCGLWALIDFIQIITGSMKMADGRDLV
jgi:TM2 domain-containing membrane protein YozV